MDRMEASTPWTMSSVDAKTTCTAFALSVPGVIVAAVDASCNVSVSFRIPCLDDSNESVATMTANATDQHVFWIGDREAAVKYRYIQANDWIGIGSLVWLVQARAGRGCDLNCLSLVSVLLRGKF